MKRDGKTLWRLYCLASGKRSYHEVCMSMYLSLDVDKFTYHKKMVRRKVRQADRLFHRLCEE